MTMTESVPQNAIHGRRRDGLVGLWGRMIHRDREAYESWLEDRDLTAVTANLLRLNERQLNRLGLSRATLAMDVEDMALRAKREAQIGMEILRLVSDDDTEDATRPAVAERYKPHAIAAE